MVSGALKRYPLKCFVSPWHWSLCQCGSDRELQAEQQKVHGIVTSMLYTVADIQTI